MVKKIKEEELALLKIYISILDNCANKLAIKYLIIRIHKILRKGFKARVVKDFPKATFEFQVIDLVNYVRQDKLAYAFLYSSSLYALIKQNDAKNSKKRVGKLRVFLGKLRAYIGM